MRNLSYENEFCMQFHFHANQSHFHKNGFALRLALKQRHKVTRKWPISLLKLDEFLMNCFLCVFVFLFFVFFFSSGVLPALLELEFNLCRNNYTPIICWESSLEESISHSVFSLTIVKT